MGSNSIDNKQLVYTNRYGNQTPHNENLQRNDSEYDSFDVPPAADTGPQSTKASRLRTPGAAQPGNEFQALDVLTEELNEEDYLVHYRDQVAPRQRVEAENLLAEVQDREDSEFGANPDGIRDLISTKEGGEFLLEGSERSGYLSRLRRILAREVGPEEKMEALAELNDEIAGKIQEIRAEETEWPQMFAEDVNAVKGQISQLEMNKKISEAKKEEWNGKLKAIADKLKKGEINLKAARNELNKLTDSWNTHLASRLEDQKTERQAALAKVRRALDNIMATPDRGYEVEFHRARDGGEGVGTFLINLFTGFIPAMVEGGKMGTNYGPDPVKSREFANAVRQALANTAELESVSTPLNPNDRTRQAVGTEELWDGVGRILDSYGGDAFQYATVLVGAIRSSAGSEAEAKAILNTLPVSIREKLITALNASGKFLTDGSKTGGFAPDQAVLLLRESVNDEEHRFYSQQQSEQAPKITWGPGSEDNENV